MKPISLSKIFTEKIFRIPDYQRGYAWQNHTVNKQLTGQLVDFWEDLMNLDPKKTHYTGVLTLEKVPEKIYKEWTEDWWLINPEGKAHEAYYIVDGQQRLTTIIILIQCILERVGDIAILNETSVADIRKKFIYQQKADGISRTYMFGYESQNPSYEFLKTKIFNEHSATNSNEESLYTYNLEKAKEFFTKQLENYDKLEELFIKLTQKMVFNEYVIENDLDVFIAFETMNNRGKPLSNLELLKNRLIYLSTLFPNEEEAEKELLRKNINACWKTIYEYLGKNKKRLLPDDVFLKAHWIMYFAYSRRKGDDYIRFLLEQFFTAKNIFQASPLIFTDVEDQETVSLGEDESEEEIEKEELVRQITVLTLKHINDYVTSMQKAVKHWYDIFNPLENTYNNLSEDEQNWLDKINRLGIGNFAPLILSIYCSNTPIVKKIEILKTIEKYIFLLFRVSQQRANTGDSEFYKAARELYYKETKIDAIITQLKKRIEDYLDLEKFSKYIKNKFTYYSKDGFYGWGGLRYFLYEHEQYLMEEAEYSGQKVSWKTFTDSYKDCVTIEHIFPQTPAKPCWIASLGSFSPDEKNILCNSIGNLLLLSQPKNSSLQNDCFDDKRKNPQVTQGYFNGSYSETRVANKYSVWTSEEIKSRSIELIEFMETRWDISFGDVNTKMELMQLGFLLPKPVEADVTE